MKKILITSIALLALSGCATIINKPNVPVAISFSDGSKGTCNLQNKRMNMNVEIPDIFQIRRSDDPINYNCNTKNNKNAKGEIPSTVGPTMIGNLISIGGFIGAAIDALNDMHREYPSEFVIPINNAKLPKQNK